MCEVAPTWCDRGANSGWSESLGEHKFEEEFGGVLKLHCNYAACTESWHAGTFKWPFIVDGTQMNNSELYTYVVYSQKIVVVVVVVFFRRESSGWE